MFEIFLTLKSPLLKYILSDYESLLERLIYCYFFVLILNFIAFGSKLKDL